MKSSGSYQQQPSVSIHQRKSSAMLYMGSREPSIRFVAKNSLMLVDGSRISRNASVRKFSASREPSLASIKDAEQPQQPPQQQEGVDDTSGLLGTKQKEAPMGIKLLFLFVCLMYPLGSQSMYDAPAALSTPFTDWYNMNDAQFGLLYSCYAFPNFITVFLVGVFVDRIGPNWSGLIFNTMIVTGSTLMYFSGHNYTLLLISFTWFGFGAGSILLSQMVLLTKWYNGSFLAVSFALSTTVLRVQSIMDYNVGPSLAAKHDAHVALTFPLAVAYFAFFCTVISFFVDKFWGPKVAVCEQSASCPTIRDFRDLPRVYWLCVLVCAGLTCGDFLFEMYGPIMYEARYAVEPAVASRAISLASTVIVFVTPVSALIVDKWGHYPELLIFGGGLEVLGGSFMLFDAGFGVWSMWLSPILYGVGYAISSSVVYVAVVHVVDPDILGTAFGIQSGILNLALFALPYLIGLFEVWTGAYFLSKVVILSCSIIGTLGAICILFSPPMEEYAKVGEPESHNGTHTNGN